MLLLFETAAVLGDVKAVVVVVFVVDTTAADRNAADINFIISFCSVYNPRKLSYFSVHLNYCSFKLNERFYCNASIFNPSSYSQRARFCINWPPKIYNRERN